IDGRFRITRHGRAWEAHEKYRRHGTPVRTLREGKRIADSRWIDRHLGQARLGASTREHYAGDQRVLGLLGDTLRGDLRALASLVAFLVRESPFKWDALNLGLEAARVGVLPVAWACR